MTATHSSGIEHKSGHRRKSSIRTVATPVKRLSPQIERQKRSVYIIARPINKAGKFRFLSEASFPFCHWGLLVSPRSPKQLRYYLKYYAKGHRNPSQFSLGTLFELYNADGMNKVNVVKDFGRDFSFEWTSMCSAFIGNTELFDYRISHRGTFHIRIPQR